MRTIVGVVGNVKHRTLNMADTPEVYLSGLPDPDGFDVDRGADHGSRIRRPSLPPSATSSRRWTPIFRWSASGFLMNTWRALWPGRASTPCCFRFSPAQPSSDRDRDLRRDGLFRFAARKEIGIRIALGAQKGDVLRLVVGGGMRLTALGLVIGVAAAFGLAGAWQPLLYGVGSFDPVTLFAAVAFLLGLIALMACWLPARRRGDRR